MAHDFVSFTDAMFSSFIDSDEVGGPAGIAEFAQDIHTDVKEANVQVRARWFELLHKMGMEFDSRQDVNDGGLFSPEEAEQRMVSAVLEQIQFSPEVAEKFISTAVRFISTLPDREERLSQIDRVISEARNPDCFRSLECSSDERSSDERSSEASDG